jgi:hypothetical protein
MDRALPEFNRVLHKKWQAYNRRLHKQKIHETRPLIDNHEPSSLKYPLIKTKKEQLLEGNNKMRFIRHRPLHRDRKGKPSSPREDDQHHDILASTYTGSTAIDPKETADRTCQGGQWNWRGTERTHTRRWG